MLSTLIPKEPVGPSSFTTPLIGEISNDGMHIKILKEFSFHIGSYPSNEVITVPVGFISDFASIPQWAQSFISKMGPYTKAAIIHDYLLEIAYKNKKFADDIFFEAMTVLKVPAWKKYIIYYAVRLGGKGNYTGENLN